MDIKFLNMFVKYTQVNNMSVNAVFADSTRSIRWKPFIVLDDTFVAMQSTFRLAGRLTTLQVDAVTDCNS